MLKKYWKWKSQLPSVVRYTPKVPLKTHIEYAPTGAAKCGCCGKKILASDVRIEMVGLAPVPRSVSPSGYAYCSHWNHLSCMSAKFLKKLKKDYSNTNLFEDLSEEDQKLLADGNPLPTL